MRWRAVLAPACTECQIGPSARKTSAVVICGTWMGRAHRRSARARRETDRPWCRHPSRCAGGSRSSARSYLRTPAPGPPSALRGERVLTLVAQSPIGERCLAGLGEHHPTPSAQANPYAPALSGCGVRHHELLHPVLRSGSRDVQIKSARAESLEIPPYFALELMRN